VAKNILLTGGNTLFPNFRERFITELRPLIPDDVDMNVSTLFLDRNERTLVTYNLLLIYLLVYTLGDTYYI
jgi:hypothetical protein